MRYHSRSPLYPRSPNYSVEILAQRSNPTCSLSLTNASASVKTSFESTPSSDLSERDLPNLLTAVPSPGRRDTIPFPKRPHSLLRGTQPTSRPLGDISKAFPTHDLDEMSSAQDLDPPRKRTRTSALSTSTRTRLYRASSTSSTKTSVPLPRYTTPPSSNLSVSSESAPIRLCSSKSHSHPSPPTSPSIFCIPPPKPSISPSLDSNSTLAVNLDVTTSFVVSCPVPHWYRRRASANEVRISFYLYRTLVYGLEVRYHDRYGKFNDLQAVSQGKDDATLVNARVRAKSHLDVQDALLAQHLENFLLVNGVDVHAIAVYMQDIAQDGLFAAVPPRSDPMAMDIDDFSDGISHTSHSDTYLHPHLHPSTTRSILSYQQLVASLQMRRHFNSSRSSSRAKGPKQCRKRSPLADSFGQD